MQTFKEFLNSIPHKFAETEEKILKLAFDFTQKAHTGQKRMSGEDYFNHSVNVSLILSKIFPDAKTLAATLLHDVPEDTKINMDEIEQNFGKEITQLVDGVTKLGKVRFRTSHDKYYVENLRKLFIATSEDIRVILIKLADRMHNMRTISFLDPEKQKKIALETLEMYAPIASRLGIGVWKDELEDLAFQIVFPHEFAKTKKLLEDELLARKENIRILEKSIEHILRTEGIKYQEIQGRVKRIYSLCQKLQRYDNDITKIYDIVALRIITRSTADCYAALGIIHKHFQPVPGRIKDYISVPKPNGYQSLHTTVFNSNGKIFEIQIRTDLMDEEAEKGVAAHWFYAEEGKPDTLGRLQSPWIKELRAWQDETQNSAEYLESLKIDFFRDRIFVFTPTGDIKDLPVGSSVIDFAFAVHSDLASHMMGAKINGKMRKIYEILKKGDVIEIIKNKKPVTMSHDWLVAAKTSGARNKIRQYLSEHDMGIIRRVKQLKIRDLSFKKFLQRKK